MKLFFKQYRITLIGLFIGASLGLLYWAKVGCSSGSCMITSHPINSSIYGAVLGAMIADTFRTKKKIITDPTIHENEQNFNY